MCEALASCKQTQMRGTERATRSLHWRASARYGQSRATLSITKKSAANASARQNAPSRRPPGPGSSRKMVEKWPRTAENELAERAVKRQPEKWLSWEHLFIHKHSLLIPQQKTTRSLYCEPLKDYC